MLSTYLLHKCIKALDYFVDTKNHLETENGSVSQEDRDERPLKWDQKPAVEECDILWSNER